MKATQPIVTIHRTVLKQEVFDLLRLEKGKGLLVDATMGEGGHSEYFLAQLPKLRVVGLDADAGILEVAKVRLEKYGERVIFCHSWFNAFFADYSDAPGRPDAVLFDLGISMYHYKRAQRGFSFQEEEDLDMRITDGLELTAKDIVNEYPLERLADLLREYGEERLAFRIASGIVKARDGEFIGSSKQLANIIARSVPTAYRYGRIHPATRSFLALRIAVNGELERLKQALPMAIKELKVGGRIAVISFHSLEDRIVKQLFREKAKECTCPADWPECRCGGRRILEVITKKPIYPTEAEISENPASRSAKLRVAEKVAEEVL